MGRCEILNSVRAARRPTNHGRYRNLANITTKELTALEEQIGMEMSLSKKYEALSGMCKDTQIVQCLSGIAQKHRQHYNTLMTFLQ